MRIVPAPGSLEGLRIAVTRSGGGDPEDRLTRMLAERGARPIPIPLTSTEPPLDREALDRLIQDLGSYDWLVVTSARAVPPLVEAIGRASVSIPEARDRGMRICPVGPRTGEALLESGLAPDLVPERFQAEGVVDAILSQSGSKDLRVLFPRSEGGRDVIPRRLRDAGAEVDVVAAYRTVPVPGAGVRLAALVSAADVDALTFTAGSAAEVFVDAWLEYRRSRALPEGGARLGIPEEIGVVAMGPATASVLQKRGVTVDRVAAPHTLEGLVCALEEWSDGRSAGPA